MNRQRIRDIHLFADSEHCKDSLGSAAPKSSVFACFGIGPPSRGLPAISDSRSKSILTHSLSPSSLHTHTHSLSLSLSSSTLVARFFAHSHAVTTQWTPTPIASKTGRKPLSHRPRVPAPRASSVHRYPVPVASPISPIPLKMLRSLHPFTLLRPRCPFVSVNVRAVAPASASVSSICLVTECLVLVPCALATLHLDRLCVLFRLVSSMPLLITLLFPPPLPYWVVRRYRYFCI